MTITQFHHFLVVKLHDRVQEISREHCSGCQLKHRFDILHPCITTPLDKRIYKFFTSAVIEALDNLKNLLDVYQATFMLSAEPSEYLNSGYCFIKALHPEQLVDRRYINEDTELTFPFDSSWVSPAEPQAKSEIQPNPEARPDKPKRQRLSKKRKTTHKVPCDDPSCCKDQTDL